MNWSAGARACGPNRLLFGESLAGVSPESRLESRWPVRGSCLRARLASSAVCVTEAVCRVVG